ncbi:MAG: histidine phosphatase family protein [Phycisphaerales bacterium]|nr:histidine phosphatase family protein [Phycisphaerales bacterium]
MRVYLIRHGKAEDKSQSGRDADRLLVGHGEEQARWLAVRLGEAPGGERPRLILASRIARARRTAELIREGIGCEMRGEPLLENSGRDDEVIEIVAARAKRGDAGALALVGHNPQISVLASRLAGADISMQTGQAAAVDIDAGGTRLVEVLRMPG